MIRVLKFGSSVLCDDGDLPVAVAAIRRELAAGHQVIAVISAFGRTTNELLTRAHRLGPARRCTATAALLATGESAAAALLTLALDHAGIPAILLDPVQAGLLVNGEPLAARPLTVDTIRLRQDLAAGPVVLPGYAGRDAASGATKLLGRGGSDLTAALLADALGGACILYKDTDGVYTADPRRDPTARRFARLSYATAMAVGGAVVQRRALRFARAHGLPILVTTPDGAAGTWIDSGPDLLAGASAADQAEQEIA